MIKVINKISIKVFCVLFFLCCLLYSYSNAFQPDFPKLVWDKEIPFEIDEIVMADSSGDVLISNKNSGQLVLIDSQGYERLHLGPKLNGAFWSINISSDGNKIMYLSYKEGERWESEADVWNLNFITKKGEIIWGKDAVGVPYMSPNADWYVINAFGETGNIKVYDASGKLLWEKMDSDVGIFSLDNNYLISKIGINYASKNEDRNMTIHTYNYQGEMKWEQIFQSDKFKSTGIAEITKGGYIVWNYKDYHKIYDYLGNIVTEIPTGVGKAFVSPDGKAVLFQYESTFQVLNLPDKGVKMEGNIVFKQAKISLGGKYIMGIRLPTNDMPEDVVFLDNEDSTIVKRKCEIDVSLDDISYLTSNGKYLILQNNFKHLYYFQLY